MGSQPVRIALFALVFAWIFTPAEAQQPILSCDVSIPEITADYKNLRYDPMPFPVTVTVENIGSALTDSISARIVLPDRDRSSLRLAGADAPDRTVKFIQHPRLFPEQSGTAQWMLRHPPTPEEKRYTVGVWVRTSNADSTYCEAEVVIPKLGWPILGPRDYVPAELVFVDSLDSYVPNPFIVRLTCVNTGNIRADSVTGTIILPKDVVLDPPGQPKTKYFNPMSMEPWSIGDPIPELEWTVRWTKRHRHDVDADFRFTVTGVHPEGMRLDSVPVWSFVHIPGLQPLFTTRHEIPDSLSLRPDGLGVEPNPFTVHFTVKNISHQTGGIDRIIIYFPTSDGLSLNPASPNPTSFDPNLTLGPGESETFEWLIDVTNRITRRNVSIKMHAYDDEWNPLMCSDRLPIANLKTGLSCRQLESSVPVLHYDAASDSYDPDSFVITTTLRNVGGANLHELVANLMWTDPSGQDLIEFDPAFPDNTNPKIQEVLFPATETEFSWGFHLKNRNTTGIPQYISFNIEYGSRETPYITSGCETYIEIDPAGTTDASGPPASSACVLHPVHPNPFTTSAAVRLTLPRAMPVTLTVTDALGREVQRLVDAELRAAGSHTLHVDAAGLHPGIYFTRLTADASVRVRKMVLMR